MPHLSLPMSSPPVQFSSRKISWMEVSGRYGGLGGSILGAVINQIVGMKWKNTSGIGGCAPVAMLAALYAVRLRIQIDAPDAKGLLGLALAYSSYID